MSLFAVAQEPPLLPLTGPKPRQRDSDAVSLSCPFRTPTGVVECLTALLAQGCRRDADQAFDEMRIGMRCAAQASDVSTANIADIALRRSPSGDLGVAGASRLLALWGHSRVVCVQARL